METLRPLGFGEIFDRAITLYVRNFFPFVGIVLLTVVPLAIIQYGVDTSEAGQFAQLFSVFTHVKSGVPALPSFSGPVIAAVLLGMVLSILIQPLVYGAVAVGVGRLYEGHPVGFRACLGPAWARWPRLLGLLAVSIAAGVVAYVAVVLGIVALVVAGFAAGRAGVAVMAVVAGLVLIALLFAVMWVFVAWTFALNGIVIEDMHVFQAIGSGFRRVFNAKEIWRALGLWFCAILIALTAQMILGIAAVAAEAFGLIWLDVALKAISGAVVLPFSVILMAVYYFDVRVRREGLDVRRRLGLVLKE